MTKNLLPCLLVLCSLACNQSKEPEKNEKSKVEFNTNAYEDLISLFRIWREFENPPKRDGAPDYTQATFEQRWPKFKELQQRLIQIDTTNWSIPEQVDWMLVWAEMNGYDFNHRVLKPWERDPAYYKSVWTYKSDVPAHEGPTHHGTTELWTYEFPLSNNEKERLMNDLKVIPALHEQAKQNLTGNAKDLWIAGIRDIRNQSVVLSGILDQPEVGKHVDLVEAISQAIAATDDFTLWLEEEAKTKTGPSGIGKENYTWYLQNVHLVPLTWEEEVMILKRELARAWASLKMEEQQNRNLPELVAAASPQAYDALAENAAKSLIDFLNSARYRYGQRLF